MALICNGQFMVSRWRTLLNRTAEVLAPRGLDATCPFGFEITGDPSWLRRPLRRFYILLGGKFQSRQSSDEVTRLFCAQLMKEILDCDRPFWESVVLVRYNRQHEVRLKDDRYQPDAGSVFLNLLALDDSRGSLHAYADYLISFLSCAQRDPHGEFTYFYEHTRVRRRLFQLYFISSKLSSALGLRTRFPPLPGGWAQLYSDEFRQFYAGQRESTPSDVEVAFYETAIVPTFLGVRNEIRRRHGSDPYCFPAEDFYSGAKIDCAIARADYETLRAVIFDTYHRYSEAMPPC